jgi:predicted transcriptional regulator
MASDPPIPTDAELALLQVLWRHGPSTVREMQRHFDRGYTTVLKQLQIMHEKGLVHRDESKRAHVYSAAVEADATQRRLIDDLAERAFGGSAQSLVLQALDASRIDADEMEAIRAMIQDALNDTPNDS